MQAATMYLPIPLIQRKLAQGYSFAGWDDVPLVAGVGEGLRSSNKITG